MHPTSANNRPRPPILSNSPRHEHPWHYRHWYYNDHYWYDPDWYDPDWYDYDWYWYYQQAQAARSRKPANSVRPTLKPNNTTDTDADKCSYYYKLGFKDGWYAAMEYAMYSYETNKNIHNNNTEPMPDPVPTPVPEPMPEPVPTPVPVPVHPLQMTSIPYNPDINQGNVG